MSAEADPLPKSEASSESSTHDSWIIPPRKFARLLSDLTRPFYLLDSEDRVRFANRFLIELLRTEESTLIGLDCSRVLTSDDHQQPELAGLLAIPHEARSGNVGLSLISTGRSSIFPWTCRLVIPIETSTGSSHVGCFWLREDDPLVTQATNRFDWLAQAEVREALLDARRTHARLDGLHSLLGVSPYAQLARRQAQAAIAGNMSVCIVGPVGCGKATLARAIYQQRRKRERKMMSEGRILPIDCRLMDRSLMEDTIELASESDVSRPQGKDHEPTALLLIGIDSLATDAYQPLSAFLRSHPTTPVFATARTRDLLSLYSDPTWHELMSYINVVMISLEPLANRIEDIAPLAESILEECCVTNTAEGPRFLSPDALHWLQAYPWPGNHRELRQSIQEAFGKSKTPSIEPNDFSLAIRTFSSHVLRPEPVASIKLDLALENFERNLLQMAIDQFPRNRAAAARHLGISRTRLLRRLAQLGIESTEREAESGVPSQSQPESNPMLDQPVFEEIHDEQ